jgi:hypothetical protein
MNSFTANPAGRRPRPACAEAGVPRRASIEDLGWPMPAPAPDKKPARPVEMWVPGRYVDWQGTTPTMQ